MDNNYNETELKIFEDTQIEENSTYTDNLTDEELEEIVINECVGFNTDMIPKSSISSTIATIPVDGNVTENNIDIKTNNYYINTETEFEVIGDFITVKFLFKQPIDEELQMMWNHLEAFGKLANDFDERKDTTFPIMYFNIIPNKADVAKLGYLSFSTPAFWFLQPRDLKRPTELNEIRILVKAESFILNRN